MTAPKGLDAVLNAFGEGVNIRDFGFNGRDAACLRFETGVSLRFEYAFEKLVIALQIPAPNNAELMKRLLEYTQPERSPSFKLRVAYLDRASTAIMVAMLPERDASLDAINAVFSDLWLMAEEFRGQIL